MVDSNIARTQLLENIKKHAQEFKDLKAYFLEHWSEADLIYRFYHGSFKVYRIQDLTQKALDLFERVKPEGIVFNADFDTIVKEGTNKRFELAHNAEWLKHTRPLLEAYFHCKYFVDMIVRILEQNEEDPFNGMLDSGSAGALYLFNLR